MMKRKYGLRKLFKPNTIFHFSTSDALLSNVFEGNTTIKEILKHGDFGIGTMNCLDGEMIIVDGKPYTVRTDGKAYEVDDLERSPISVVTHFKKDYSFNICTPIKYSQLIEKINSLLSTQNIFYPIKIIGEFKYITTRSIAKQSKPFKLIEDLIKDAVKFNFTNIQGTVLGFKSPSFIERIGVPGYHFHFIDKERKVGGHLLDFEMVTGRIEYAIARDFHVKLEDSEIYDNIDLSESKNDLLQKIEKL
ncbi:MAG: acetolactate decarboxylase [Bacteroidales bacterium]|nr:acetolactate decarboxylase [Bacteroidales bacterium]